MIADRDDDASLAGVNSEPGDGVPKAEPDARLRTIDDETLLDMFDHAHETGDEHCEAISAELQWRGIEVPACRHEHAA